MNEKQPEYIWYSELTNLDELVKKLLKLEEEKNERNK